MTIKKDVLQDSVNILILGDFAVDLSALEQNGLFNG